MAKLSVVGQKNALQKLIQKYVGELETEKKFDWLKTPDTDNVPKEYTKIVDALIKYRKQKGFFKSNYKLACDMVVDKKKLIFEYDERQHFSTAREISLKNYPRNISLLYSKKDWIKACADIKAIDNDPKDRDERRAYFDSVRDIEAFKNGYKLIRIKHGDVDWEAKGAEKDLKKLISTGNVITKSSKKEKVERHKIARIITTNQYNEKMFSHKEDKLYALIYNFLDSTYGKMHFKFIVTAGGFLRFYHECSEEIDIEKVKETTLRNIQNYANKILTDFFNGLSKSALKKLKETANYFTIGIDGIINAKNQYCLIELVAIYDLKKEKVIRWTGKFYPVEFQKKYLIIINDLNSHFIELNGEKILVLGCHDLKIYSSRGQSRVSPNSYKGKVSKKFRNMCKKYKPDIVLQHPHTADTPNVWAQEWKNLEKDLPSVKHYASGIRYYNNGKKCRGTLKDVLEKTKKGDVIDFK